MDENEIGKIVGNKIRKLRIEKHLSQEALGQEAGLHRAYIGQIERGEKDVGLKNLSKFAKALGVDVRRLFE